MLVARVARADDPPVAMAPGTFGDPAHELELSPSFLLVPGDDVPAGIAIRDADPSRVKVFVDGFEVPNQLVNGRSVFFGSDISQVRAFDNGMDLAYGGATGGGLEVTTRDPNGQWATLAATPSDVTLTTSIPSEVLGLRFGFLAPERAHSLDVIWNDHVDLQGRREWRLSQHWRLAISAYEMFAGDWYGRGTLTASYRDGRTSASLAASAMYVADSGATSLDTRADLRHRLRDVAGLPQLELRGGANTSTTIGDTTTFDGGAWASLGAMIGKDVAFVGGVRLDVFDQQVSLSPRGALAAMFGHVGVAIAASAYRQAQVDRDATPERATEVIARVHRQWGAARTSLAAYYIDRSRILVDDRATGVGAVRGVELREQVRQGSWLVYAAVAYSQATRADRLTAPDHPADLDIPLRIDLLAQWKHREWLFGARAQLRSGLPYTPVAGAVYDADTDTYSALYGKLNADRAPWRHEVDLRVDRFFARHFHAYLDVAIDGGVLGYTYSYDYSRRLDVRAVPVLPWLGISGTL